ALPNVNTEQAMPRHEPTPASSASHYLPMVDNSLRESEGAGADARRDSEPTSADAEETAAEGSGLAEIVSAEAAGPSPSEAEPELDPLRNQAWVNLVEEIVEFFEEVDRVRFEGHRDADDFADHVCCRLEEILQRSGVTIISNETVFDRTRHVPQGAVARGNAGDAILETLSPGFSVGRRVFRRALVRLADPDSLSPGAAP
ncbi:MAG: hypothetical protein N2039_15610, partial [Gemmataceae bacterium]|nr:hypothetical protein [Gemmataceae bacterium]